MSYLYRHALLVSWKQPFLDWVNGLDPDEPDLGKEGQREHRAVYLVPEAEGEPVFAELLDEFWEDIFEEQLRSWLVEEERWPHPRTREVFDEWFAVELNESVYDLTPAEPLTQADVELADLAEAAGRCAICGIDVEEGDGRFVGFKLADRSWFEPFEGRVLPLRVRHDEIVLCIVTPKDSDEAQRGDDLLVRACSSRCEKGVRKIVPRALRAWLQRVENIRLRSTTN